MTHSSSKKSTTVLLFRSTFRLAEALAPGWGARLAERLWFTLPSRRPEAGELPSGAARFEVTALGATIRGATWGEGPVVYLVHGWGGRGSQFASYVAPLVERGFRVVMFDGASHGDSTPGPSGPRSSTGVEFGKALDAVAARYGPAHAVVAHSMGAVATMLALKHGWLSSTRVALVAPMIRVSSQLDGVQKRLGIGPRTRRRLEVRAGRRVGVPVVDFDVQVLAGMVPAMDFLVVHDDGDRETSYADSASFVAATPNARLVTTSGLGHRRIVADPTVVREVCGFIADRAAVERAGAGGLETVAGAAG